MILQLTGVALGFVILWRIQRMSQELQRLQQDVADQSAVIDSAVSLIEGLAQQIRDNANDPAALSDLADSLESNSGKLSAAVATNTAAADGEPIPADDLKPIDATGADTATDTTAEDGA